MFIINLNLANNQLAHIKSCKGPTTGADRGVEDPLQHPGTKKLLNILFVCCKFFKCTIQEDDNVSNHVNKVIVNINQLVCLEILV